MRILLVEDEKKLASALVQGFTKSGYAIDSIDNGTKAFNRLTLNHMDYDLVILDLMLPGMDGSDICKGIRERNITTPILILTARDEIENKVNLLMTGADDYMVKPFSFNELLARTSAILRRPQEAIPIILKIRNIELDSNKHQVLMDGLPVPLTLKEYMLLEYFMRHPNKVLNREELLSHLWDFNYPSFSNVVDVHVKNLRRKLNFKNDDNLLETIRGVGYRLKE